MTAEKTISLLPDSKVPEIIREVTNVLRAARHHMYGRCKYDSILHINLTSEVEEICNRIMELGDVLRFCRLRDELTHVHNIANLSGSSEVKEHCSAIISLCTDARGLCNRSSVENEIIALGDKLLEIANKEEP